MTNVATRDVQSALESVFLSPTWQSTQIQVVPDDLPLYGEGIKYKILMSSKQFYYGGFGVTGHFIASVYTRAGRGPTRANEIIDLLTTHFQGQTMDGNLHTGPSTLIDMGIDQDDPSLIRTDFRVSFNKFK